MFPQILDAANEFTKNPEFVMTNEEELDVPLLIGTRFQLGVPTAVGFWPLLARMGDDDRVLYSATPAHGRPCSSTLAEAQVRCCRLA